MDYPSNSLSEKTKAKHYKPITKKMQVFIVFGIILGLSAILTCITCTVLWIKNGKIYIQRLWMIKYSNLFSKENNLKFFQSDPFNQGKFRLTNFILSHNLNYIEFDEFI